MQSKIFAAPLFLALARPVSPITGSASAVNGGGYSDESLCRLISRLPAIVLSTRAMTPLLRGPPYVICHVRVSRSKDEFFTADIKDNGCLSFACLFSGRVYFYMTCSAIPTNFPQVYSASMWIRCRLVLLYRHGETVEARFQKFRSFVLFLIDFY